MKILSTGNMQSEIFKNGKFSFQRPARKKDMENDFQKILEQTLSDTQEDPDEFRILLPRHGHFWDNGYEDLE